MIGVDVNPPKIDFLRQGKAPVVEERIGELIAEVVAIGRAHRQPTTPTAAVLDTDISIVCVGTPSAPGGGLSTEYLERASDGDRRRAGRARTAGTSSSSAARWCPGTCEKHARSRSLEQASGKRAGVDFGVCVNPEFLREGTSVRDFFEPAQDRRRRERRAQRRRW